MKKLYFIVGSQDLYGEECLKQVAEDSRQMVAFLNEKVGDLAEIELLPTVETSEICIQDMRKASNDDDCVGVITWMHTFSPAKMWIKGLQELRKPLLHLHTQANEKLPYDEIDMDFMNLNQSAHGDREYGFIVARMGIPHEVVAGYYKHDDVVAKIRQFASVAKAISYSKSLKVASFGNNMREVAVTDGDRVESQIKYGWECNYYALGDLVDIINQVTEEEIDAKMKEYTDKYTMKTDRIDSVREQAKYEVGLEKFLFTNGIGAFADTFQDLHGLKQLPEPNGKGHRLWSGGRLQDFRSVCSPDEDVRGQRGSNRIYRGLYLRSDSGTGVRVSFPYAGGSAGICSNQTGD